MRATLVSQIICTLNVETLYRRQLSVEPGKNVPKIHWFLPNLHNQRAFRKLEVLGLLHMALS